MAGSGSEAVEERCTQCGRRGPYQPGWLVAPRADRPADVLCRPCSGRAAGLEHLGHGLALGTFGALALWQAVQLDAAALPAFALLLVPLTTVLLFVHETGHLVVALILRWRVVAVSVGTAPRPRRHLRETVIRFGGWPTRGQVWATPRTEEVSRFRQALFSAGGPLADAAVLVAAVVAPSGAGFVSALRAAVIVVAGFDLVANLLPISGFFPSLRPDRPRNNDGQALRALSVLTDDVVARLAESPAELPALRAEAEGADPVGAAQVALAVSPTAPVVQGRLAVALVADGRFAEAAPVVRGVLGGDGLDRPSRALFESYLAWSLWVTEGVTDEVRRLVRQAAAALPWSSQVLEVRAFVGAADGDSSGPDLLRRALAWEPDPSRRSAQLAGMAAVLAGSDADQARRLLAEARAWDPTVPEVRQAMVLLGDADSGSSV